VELFLNLVWVALAVCIVGVWFRRENRSEADRRMQWVALAVLIAVLFPVISVSDDLLTLQNASEVDSCLRRDHLVRSITHPALPAKANVPVPVVAGPIFGFLGFVAADRFFQARLQYPERAAVQNRPPPAS
jgi:hypothetical protein